MDGPKPKDGEGKIEAMGKMPWFKRSVDGVNS